MKDSERLGVASLAFFAAAILVAVFGGMSVAIVSCFSSGRFC